MYKYLYFILLALFGFSNLALADTTSLKITEIMYDFPGLDDKHEWIEIGNTGGQPVDISGWKIVDGGSITKHSINLPDKNGSIGSPIIPPGGFLVLADDALTYLADNPGYAGPVFDSTFSLSNTGATIQIFDKNDTLIDQVTYSSAKGAAGDGHTLQRQTDDSFQSLAPTPGAANASPPPPSDGGGGNSDSSSDPPPTSNESPKMIINEIMYDLSGSDEGREWIEIYNAGSGDADLSSLKLFESETNHGITSSNSSIVPAGSLAIIANNPEKFLIDWPAFSGLIFDSAFSLANTGETIALKDSAGHIIDQVSYTSDQGANGDGHSLQKNANVWIHAWPTPGAVNKTANEEPTTNNNSGGGSTGSGGGGSIGSGGGETSSPTNPKIPKAAKPIPISLKIDSPDYVISNADFVIATKITGVEVNQPTGKYVWNFGNGEVIEATNNESFTYHYQFPGSYMITLNYLNDDKSKPVKATAKIKVEENPISIISVKEDGSVEIKNQAKHQEDISGWILQKGNLHFTIPLETVLLPESKIVLPAKVIKFSPEASEINLFYPSGKIAFTFGQPKFEKPEQEKIKNSPPSSLFQEEVKTNSLDKKESTRVIPDNNQVKGAHLSASVVNSLPADQSGGQARPLFPWVLGLGGIILLSSVLSLFLFSKGAHPEAGFVLKND